MKIRYKKQIQLVATVVLSVLFLYIAFRSLEFNKILYAFQDYNLWWLIPVTAIVTFTILLRAMRWKLILKPVKEVKTNILFEAIVLSWFTNMLLPINIGEIVRAYILKKKAKISMASVFGSIAIERIISILGFLLVGFFAVLLIKLPEKFIVLNDKVLNGLKISTALLLLLIIIVFLLRKYNQRISLFLSCITSKLTKKQIINSVQIYNNFIHGLNLGKSNKDKVLIIFYSVLIRLAFATLTLSIAKGFGVEIPLLTFLFIDIFVSFAHSLVGHFGIIGTYEAALTYSLFVFGVPKEIGLGIALIADVTFIAPSLILGTYYFIKEGLTFKKIKALRN